MLIYWQETIELRTWNAKYRGEFLIHVSNKLDHELCKLYKINIDKLVRGAVIGKATIYNASLQEQERFH